MSRNSSKQNASAVSLNERTRIWLDSQHGQQVVLKAVNSGVKAAEELNKARVLTQEERQEPFTV